MKLVSKVILLAAFILAGHFTAQAQLGIGGRVGINVANVGGDDAGDPDSKIGLDIGVILNIPASQAFSVQPELHFLQKGSKDEDPFSGAEVKTTLSYIQIPILGKYTFGDPESVGFYVLGGPSIGFGVNTSVEVGDIEVSGSFDEAELNGFEFGVDVGAGVLIPAGPGQFFIDIRYLLGLSNVPDGDADVKNRGINFGVGFLSTIGG